MAYLSLYRKYRPQTFGEILGQDHVSQTLSNAISEDRVAHAYLFTGPRGTGKTSTARILAKALNCAEGPNASPCGRCNSCVSIADGSSLDVIEMDAASHSKVDETREILAGVPLATAGGRRKVYVIDEVHMLSTAAFNALLKTLEEPPPHVVFVLATTEAHKVLPTIVSRTQRFDFRRVSSDVLETHLAHVAKLEEIDVAEEAFSVVARHSEGSVRDALSVLDQLASLGGHIAAEDAERVLGERSEDALHQIFDAIGAADVASIFQTLDGLIRQGADVRQLTLGAISHARSLLFIKTAPDAEELLDVSDHERAAIGEQAQRLSLGSLMRALDLLSTALTEMRNAPEHRLLLEIALVRAAAPETDPSARGLMGRIERLERRIGIEATGSTDVSDEGAAVAEPRQPRKSAPVPQTQARAPQTKAAPAVPKDETGPAESPPQTESRSEEKAAAPPSQEVPGEIGLSHVREAWPATLEEVKRRKVRVSAFLSPSRPVHFDGSTLSIEVQSEFHQDSMSDPRNSGVLGEALFAALGIKPSLKFVARSGSSQPATPVDETPDVATTKSVEDHDPVELVKKGLHAEVVEERS